MVVSESTRTWVWLVALSVLLSIAGRSAHASPPTPSTAASEHPSEASEASEQPPARGFELDASFEPPDDPERMGLIWRPTSVAWPLVPVATGPVHGADAFAQLAARLDQREAMREGRAPAPSVRGPVSIDADRAVGVWIAALETIRVRQVGPAVPLRFVRGVDGHTAVLEPGRELPAGPGGERRWELHQPPSTGAVWTIEADAATTVVVERVEDRPARYVSVEIEHEVLRWIADGLGSERMPSLLAPADELERRLRLHAAIAAELERLAAGERELGKALTAWRQLAAMRELDRTRPMVLPYYMRDRGGSIDLDDTRDVRLATEDTRDYLLAEHPRRWTITRKGAGQLRISARAWAGAGQALQPAELRVYAGGALIDRLPLSNRQAKHSLDPDSALPQLAPLVTEAGDVVGEFGSTTIVTAPGRHDYEIELVGGPALLELVGAKRTESSLASVRGWTPHKRARAVARALGKSRAPERVWVELLLAAHTASPATLEPDDPRLAELGERSPLLAVAILGLLATDAELDDDATSELVERVRPLLAALSRDEQIDPAVRGQLRAHWLALAAAHGRGRIVDLLIERVPGGADPIAELPVAGLRVLAELLQPTGLTVRSPALAVLELARTRAPADEDLRGQTLRMWTAVTRWSRRRPVANEAGVPLEPAGEWLVAREQMPIDPAELADTWVRLEPGKPVKLRATLGADAVRRELEDGGQAAETARRLRLLDVYISTPLDDPSPVELRVDDRSWWSPMLFGVQRHRVAVNEGVHEVELDAPAQTVAWAELPPADALPREPGELGRRERMWPLAGSTWPLPGPAVPAIVRLELRYLATSEPRPVRIRVHEHGDYPDGHAPAVKTVVFDPRAASQQQQARDWALDSVFISERMPIDRGATPIANSAWASPRYDLNLGVHAATTALSFEVEDGVEIAASLSLRRGLRPSDVISTDTHVDPPTPEDELVSYDHVFAGLERLDGEGLLAELRGLSRVLLLDGDDLERRARRAALLLMLGETGHARADLVRLTAWADNPRLDLRKRALAEDLLRELELRFEALIEPREIVVADPRRATEPTLVEPALAAFIGADRSMLEPRLETWARLRMQSTDDALRDIEAEIQHLLELRASGQVGADFEHALLLARLTRAHLLSRDPGRARDAGRAWLELYGRMPGALGRLRDPIAVGLAAVDPLLVHLDDPRSDARDAGLAYGLARELEPGYGHTRVRRLAFVAALRSDWSTLEHSENNSGFERLELPIAELEFSPEARVREALLVAPWPRNEAEELRPGRKGVLAWDATPGTVRAEFWCRAARPDLVPQLADAADDPRALTGASLRVRLRGDAGSNLDLRRELRVPDAELVAIELPLERAARHQLEVVLDPDPLWLCSWRTRTSSAGTATDGEVVEASRRALWWTADSTNEVELILLGPASVELQSRVATNPDPDRQASILHASIERLDGPQRRDRGELVVDGERERAVITESRRSFDVAHANTHTLLLTEAVPYRVRVRSDRGRAFIRARVRRDRGDIPPLGQFSIREIEPAAVVVSEGFDWRSIGPAQPVVARDEPAPIRNRLGSLDARVSAGLDDLADTDNFQPRLGMLARVGWRRELIADTIWLAAWAQTAIRADTAPAFGGIVRFGAKVPVLGLRLGAELDALASSFRGQPEASMRLYAFVDRPIRLGHRWQLRPGLTAGVRWQSLNPGESGGGPLQPHPRVYLRYIEDHPVLVQPELELRYWAFQDMALWLQAELMPNLNGDAVAIDHVDVEFGLDGIGRTPHPWVPMWGLSYEASTRLGDRDRDTTELRNRIAAEIGVGVWARDIARIAFGVANQLYITQPLTGSIGPIGPTGPELRDVIEVWIRLDAVWGRRLRDYGPGELWFAEPWAPRSFADDEHQARSTQGALRRRR